MIYRIGFACKYKHPDQSLSKKELEEIQRSFNSKTTTNTWLSRQTTAQAEAKLQDIVDHNLSALLNLIQYVGSLDPQLRMVRISSDILPFYTHDKWKYFHRCSNRQAQYETAFKQIRSAIDRYSIKISFHPGQYTVLASDNPKVINQSIEEFEYHVDMARWMGYGNAFQDGCKINIHVGGRLGPQGIKDTLPRLSPEARNLITIENQEIKWGLNQILELADDCALVLDIHHHWINTGEYIQPSDPRVKQVIDSWRGARPTMHYSVSPESILKDHCKNTLPDLNALVNSGYKKGKLRAHSDYFWNVKANDWALSFLDKFDIMCESKAKNLASIWLLDYYRFDF